MTWEPTREEYYADPAIGSSAMKVFMESSIGFYHRYIARDVVEPEPSDQVLVGAYVDALLTDPGRLSEFQPHDGKQRSAKAKAEAAERGVSLLLPHQIARAEAIAGAVKANALASELLSGKRQFCHRWEDQAGVTCRLRVDSLKKLADGRVLNVDLKVWTGVSPRALPDGGWDLYNAEKRAETTGAHHQMALYERGLADAEYPEVQWVWVVAPPDPPFEEIVILQPSASLMWDARAKVDKALTDLGLLMAHPDAKGPAVWMPGYTDKILTLGRTVRARRSDERQEIHSYA